MTTAEYLRRERLLVALFLFFVIATLAHFVHAGWDLTIHSVPNVPTVPVGPPASQLYAPNVYRVAMPTIYAWAARLPLVAASKFTLTDVLFGYPALFLLYLAAAGQWSAEPGQRTRRAIAVSCFLAAIQFPVAWVVPMQRPETMPTAFFLAASSYVLTRLRSGLGPFLLLALLTLFQGFVRADVPCFFGLAVLLLCADKTWLQDFASRARCLSAGVLVAGIAVLVQAYLQFVRYPHRPYPPNTPVFMFRYNMSPHYLMILLIVLLPFAAVFFAAASQGLRLRSLDRVALIASLLYLPFWFTVGVVGEVRIYVPFLLLLTIPCSRLLATMLIPD